MTAYHTERRKTKTTGHVSDGAYFFGKTTFRRGLYKIYIFYGFSERAEGTAKRETIFLTSSTHSIVSNWG